MIAQRDFTTELRTYHQHEQELQKYLHQWVAIVGTEISGIYETFEQAIAESSRKRELDKVFLHEITPIGHNPMITRFFAPH